MSDAQPPDRSADLPRRSGTRPTPTPTARPRRSSKRAQLRRVLASPGALRQVFLLREVLDPPVALRDQTRRGP